VTGNCKGKKSGSRGRSRHYPPPQLTGLIEEGSASTGEVLGTAPQLSDYGFGTEGWVRAADGKTGAAFVGGKVPWWCLFTARIGVTPYLVVNEDSNLWGTASALVGPDVVHVCGPQEMAAATLGQGSRPRGIKILFCNERCPPREAAWWKSEELRYVVSLKGTSGRAPMRWAAARLTVDHAHSGGSSDASGTFLVWHRGDLGTPKLLAAGFPKQPQQDLRGILKMGTWGQQVPPPTDWCRESMEKVVPYGEQAVDACGLYPSQRGWEVPVRTRFGGQLYVLRGLEVKEQMQVLDVPEKLVRECLEGHLESLRNTVAVPLKLYQVIAERLGMLLDVGRPEDGTPTNRESSGNEYERSGESRGRTSDDLRRENQSRKRSGSQIRSHRDPEEDRGKKVGKKESPFQP
jgi:hypothetical protein